MPTTAEYFTYANLQMAAEAFLVDRSGNLLTDPVALKKALTDGNLHASRFTAQLANQFLDPDTGWTVVAQCPNSNTGFSGTLFRNNDTDELVLSFRSTEFIDDAARDSRATNELEIKEKGFAFGQLADMELWYRSLIANGTIGNTDQISVTGYSLGAHLSTAFNLMHGNETLTVGTEQVNGISEVVTFNGAGIGRIGDGSENAMGRLPEMIQWFLDLRDQATAGGLSDLMRTQWGRNAYQAIKAAWSVGQPRPGDFVINDILSDLHTSPAGYPPPNQRGQSHLTF